MSPAGYHDDLAYIHDVGFTDLAERAAEFVIDLLRSRGIADGLILELGCGSGATAARLVAAGYEVEAIDQSEAMLALARARLPAARFRAGSFLTAPLPACDAVLAVGEVLNYAFDAGNTHAALATVFGRVARCLRPGGVFVFDLAGPGRAAAARTWTAGPDWAVLVHNEEDRERRTLTRRIVSFRAAENELYRRREEVHTLLLHTPEDVLTQLRRAGLRRAQTQRGYARPADTGLAVYVASLE
jgi:SAM-dependent methyltransferase